MTKTNVEKLLHKYPIETNALLNYNRCLCGRPGPNRGSFENGWDSAINTILLNWKDDD